MSKKSEKERKRGCRKAEEETQRQVWSISGRVTRDSLPSSGPSWGCLSKVFAALVTAYAVMRFSIEVYVLSLDISTNQAAEVICPTIPTIEVTEVAIVSPSPVLTPTDTLTPIPNGGVLIKNDK